MDAEGNLLPRISEVWEPGDRVNTVDTLVESKPYEQKYILFQVTFTNHGKQDYHYTTGFSLNFYDKDENGNLVKSLALLNDRNATTDEFMYLSRNAEGKVSDRPLNGLELTAGETKTVTIGYRCDERLLDQAYLTCKIGYDDALELTALKVQKDG